MHWSSNSWKFFLSEMHPRPNQTRFLFFLTVHIVLINLCILVFIFFLFPCLGIFPKRNTYLMNFFIRSLGHWTLSTFCSASPPVNALNKLEGHTWCSLYPFWYVLQKHSYHLVLFFFSFCYFFQPTGGQTLIFSSNAHLLLFFNWPVVSYLYLVISFECWVYQALF